MPAYTIQTLTADGPSYRRFEGDYAAAVNHIRDDWRVTGRDIKLYCPGDMFYSHWIDSKGLARDRNPLSGLPREEQLERAE